MISIINVSVSRFGKEIFSNLNLTIRKGEHWLIQGENGSGKTLLLELIAGNVLPSKGLVNYDFVNQSQGWDERYQQRKSQIHFIPVHALSHLLGMQSDIYYQQRYYSIGDERLPTVQNYFGEDLINLPGLSLPDSFDVQQLLNLELTRLSNGQVKKVILIRHLLKNIPKVLLLDYPFEGLDAQSRLDLSRFIDHLANDLGILVILTDHHHELPKVITKKLVLKNLSIESIEDVVPQSAAHTFQYSPRPVNVDATPVVEMQNVTIQYGKKKILHEFNWQIRKGERWALTGKNGSGKTTLFSLIYADHPLAYSQGVYLFGKRRGSGESIWDIKRRISYLGPEQIHFLDHHQQSLSIQSYLSSLRDVALSRLPKLLLFFGVDGLDRTLQHLSSGELQLVLLIGFFMSEKELLLLDEPFQFLDPYQKGKVNEYLNEFIHPGSTLVLITHYEADIEKWTQLRMRLE